MNLRRNPGWTSLFEVERGSVAARRTRHIAQRAAAAAENSRALAGVLAGEEAPPHCRLHVAVEMQLVEMPRFYSKQGSARHRLDRVAWKCPVQNCPCVAAALADCDEDEDEEI